MTVSLQIERSDTCYATGASTAFALCLRVLTSVQRTVCWYQQKPCVFSFRSKALSTQGRLSGISISLGPEESLLET